MTSPEFGAIVALGLSTIAIVSCISAHQRIDRMRVIELPDSLAPRFGDTSDPVVNAASHAFADATWRGGADPANQSPSSMLGDERREEPVD